MTQAQRYSSGRATEFWRSFLSIPTQKEPPSFRSFSDADVSKIVEAARLYSQIFYDSRFHMDQKSSSFIDDFNALDLTLRRACMPEFCRNLPRHHLRKLFENVDLSFYTSASVFSREEVEVLANIFDLGVMPVKNFHNLEESVRKQVVVYLSSNGLSTLNLLENLDYFEGLEHNSKNVSTVCQLFSEFYRFNKSIPEKVLSGFLNLDPMFRAEVVLKMLSFGLPHDLVDLNLPFARFIEQSKDPIEQAECLLRLASKPDDPRFVIFTTLSTEIKAMYIIKFRTKFIKEILGDQSEDIFKSIISYILNSNDKVGTAFNAILALSNNSLDPKFFESHFFSLPPSITSAVGLLLADCNNLPKNQLSFLIRNLDLFMEDMAEKEKFIEKMKKFEQRVLSEIDGLELEKYMKLYPKEERAALCLYSGKEHEAIAFAKLYGFDFAECFDQLLDRFSILSCIPSSTTVEQRAEVMRFILESRMLFSYDAVRVENAIVSFNNRSNMQLADLAETLAVITKLSVMRRESAGLSREKKWNTQVFAAVCIHLYLELPEMMPNDILDEKNIRISSIERCINMLPLKLDEPLNIIRNTVPERICQKLIFFNAFNYATNFLTNDPGIDRIVPLMSPDLKVRFITSFLLRDGSTRSLGVLSFAKGLDNSRLSQLVNPAKEAIQELLLDEQKVKLFGEFTLSDTLMALPFDVTNDLLGVLHKAPKGFFLHHVARLSPHCAFRFASALALSDSEEVSNLAFSWVLKNDPESHYFMVKEVLSRGNSTSTKSLALDRVADGSAKLSSDEIAQLYDLVSLIPLPLISQMFVIADRLPNSQRFAVLSRFIRSKEVSLFVFSAKSEELKRIATSLPPSLRDDIMAIASEKRGTDAIFAEVLTADLLQSMHGRSPDELFYLLKSGLSARDKRVALRSLLLSEIHLPGDIRKSFLNFARISLHPEVREIAIKKLEELRSLENSRG